MRNPLYSLLQRVYYAVGGRGLGRLKPLRALYDLLFHWLRPRRVMVQGHLMWLDDRDTLELAVRQTYEPVETGLFLSQVRKGDLVLDIGANIGYYTLLAARQVGPEGTVYAFEPDPANFELLQRNVEANGYRNVVMVEKAVSDRARTLRLFRSESNRGDHRLFDSKDGRRSISVPTLALDSYLKKMDKPVHFIKMDIQGAEALALAGMRGLIRKNRRLKMVTEFSPGNMRLCGSDPDKFLDDLKKAGFKCQEVSEAEKGLKPFDPGALARKAQKDPGFYTNLYCVKEK